MVECDLAKVEVAGSNPVSRSKTFQPLIFPRSSLKSLKHQWLVNRAHRQIEARDANVDIEKARYPSGKGEVCKTFMRRFDSDPRLHSQPVINQHIVRGITEFVLILRYALCRGVGERRANEHRSHDHDLRPAQRRLQV